MIVSATNVHQGGGAVLLRELLMNCESNETVTVLVDERFPIPENLGENIQIEQISPSIAERFRAERRLQALSSADETIICFGNLPPLFPVSGHVTVFLQNRYLIDPDAPLRALPWRVAVRLMLEKLWLNLRRGNADQFVVQTPSMQALAKAALGDKVAVCAFVPERFMAAGSKGLNEQAPDPCEKDYDFVYVASGEAHKSHQVLLDAWKLLASESLFPSLCLTLPKDRFAQKLARIEQDAERYGLHITNLADLSYEEVQDLYKKSRAMIYPSTFESFGLPLIEARDAGLPILASELDYVRDVVEPTVTFDPTSPTSIARAVKRFLNREHEQVTLCDGKAFGELARNQAIIE